MITEANLPDALVAYRAEHKISQGQLAALLGVSIRTVGNWELGKVMPQVVVRRRVEEVLGGGLALDVAATGSFEPEAIEIRVAETLRVEMARRMLNQDEVAEAAGVSQSQFSKMLRGVRPMTIGQADRALRAVGLSGLEIT